MVRYILGKNFVRKENLPNLLFRLTILQNFEFYRNIAIEGFSMYFLEKNFLIDGKCLSLAHNT